ncbi:TonB-dependent receptor [Novosphingobium aerophilum]|uniref:TonB-dependent receptor n=1 Tax=Novosphingobium aerophilum TaxID=2839843 RepID=A0A7X1FAL1_9SPHN|nr:TonB-dependent receptor [Novosphingobium aerophilum]MBC2653460.1 TonB-dependent receptor [Novosphingobium aerophilum]
MAGIGQVFASREGRAWGGSIRRSRTILFLGVALAGISGEARAQANDPQKDEAQVGEIVVSATRRGDQTAQNIPLAIDAYSAETLSRYNVSSVQDLTKLNPSLNVVAQGATQQRIIIRGISSAVGSTTGVYFDEAPLIGPFNADVGGDGTPGLRMIDIDHVEVLKGPQGTLFGAGSMSGTLRTVVRKPSLTDAEGAVDGSWGFIDGGNARFNGSAAVSVPLVNDRLGIRLVGWTDQGGGYIDKRFGNGGVKENANDVDLFGGRAMLRWRPVDRLTIDLAANFQNTTVNGPQYVTPSVGFQPTPTGLGAYANFDPTAESYREKYQLYSASADLDVGIGNIVASGSYGHKKLLDIIDTSGQICTASGGFLCVGSSFGYPGLYSNDIKFEDYTAELRFASKFSGPLQLVAGVYYQHDKRDTRGAAIATNAGTGTAICNTWQICHDEGLIQPGFGNNPVLFAQGDVFKTDQYAAYAQIDYKILPTVTATAGIRYFRAKLDDQQTSYQIVFPDFFFGNVTTPSTSAPLKDTQSATTYNFALLWKPVPTVSIYARAASGFRIGGINTAAAQANQGGTTVVPVSYRPDSLWNYEVGAKVALFDRRVLLDVSGYRIDWKNQQLNALALGAYNYQINAGLTRTYGAEGSITLLPTSGLSLGASITYVDSKLKSNLPADVVNGGTPGQSGDRVPYVPHWSFSARGEYEMPVSDTVKAYVQSDVSYKGSSYTQFRPVSAAQLSAGVPENYYTLVPSYWLWNARVGARVGDVDLSLFVENITNKFAVVGAKQDVNSLRYFTARPRTIGLSGSLKF